MERSKEDAAARALLANSISSEPGLASAQVTREGSGVVQTPDSESMRRGAATTLSPLALERLRGVEPKLRWLTGVVHAEAAACDACGVVDAACLAGRDTGTHEFFYLFTASSFFQCSSWRCAQIAPRGQ